MVEKLSNALTDIEKEALKFLERDFNQCFQQIRHYDSQIFEAFKFLFTAYLALVGFALTTFQVGIKEGIDLRIPGAMALGLGIILGMFMLTIVIRNRVYFVQTIRYLNEQRGLFFSYRPLGFSNKSKMYTNSSLPHFFDRRSSQAWFAYIIAFMNGILFGVSIYIILGAITQMTIYHILGWPLLFVILQLLISRWYLTTRENKPAESGILGAHADDEEH